MAGENAPQLVQQYFRVKARQLATMADLPICEHNSLAGSHREELQRIFLQEILPRRFAVGRGMVYGPIHRSKEADIVLWDAQNFPSLPLQDHSFFFAESVRVVLECKSRWTDKAFKDVLDKCRAVRDIIALPSPDTLDDRINMIEQVVGAMQSGKELAGILINRPHIASAAIFLRGGATFTAESINDEDLKHVDDCWPDLLLLLEPGRVVVKNYLQTSAMGGRGLIKFFEPGEDALALFTSELLRKLAERSVQVEETFYLQNYLFGIEGMNAVEEFEFPLTRPMTTRTPIHWEPGEHHAK